MPEKAGTKKFKNVAFVSVITKGGYYGDLEHELDFMCKT